MKKERFEEIKQHLSALKEFLDYDSSEMITELESEVDSYIPKDAYGIPNVCFSLMKSTDDNWETSKKDRCERGFDNSECWNLDTTIIKFILPRLKIFTEQTNGYPPEITFEEWKIILNKIIKAFEYYLDEDDSITIEFQRKGFNTFKASQEMQKVIEEGFQLFIKYFSSLWW